ncbi:hypothetical protein [Demequina oxidasica]|uniref:hypothetical protein n=1 Tax=Demequina oxidasica TaxID=676199 RepID=UPI0007845657|nr:hypothetical protein [Demequina oxidasica]
MDALRYILLILHLIGMAAILGPFLGQWTAKTKSITKTMVWGARAQLITGLGLVGVAYASDHEPDHVKIAVKLIIALAIVAICEATSKKSGSVKTAWWLVGGLTVANIVVAVVWN